MSNKQLVIKLLDALIAEHNFLTDEKDSKGNAIQLYELYEHIEQKSKDFKYDYKVALDYINIFKNRYHNVLPDEKTRFTSKNLSYINANVINNKYILTQGPISGHIKDFWTMIFDSNADTIVCLANQFEKGQLKFNTYFNDADVETYGRFNVKVESVTNYNMYNLIVRKLRLSCDGFDEPKIKIINHIQYTGWPDHGVPTNISDFLKILTTIKELTNQSPIVIHCSAGIGRTGTLTVVKEILDTIKSILDDQKPRTGYMINIPETVLYLRQFREGLVQSEEQLEFCYLAIIEGIKMLLSERTQHNVSS